MRTQVCPIRALRWNWSNIFTRAPTTLPEITIEGWSEAIEGTRVGVYDALASVWYSRDREKDLLFSEPYLRSELLILKLRTNAGAFTATCKIWPVAAWG